MDWLDDADKRLRRFKEREHTISEHEGEIYDSLWEELKRHVASARERDAFASIETNGKPESRVIFFPRSDRQPLPFPTFTRQVTVSLLRDKHQIVAAIADADRGGVRATETFQIDVRGDGVICLKRAGKVLPLKEAAIYILWPFLYPELPPYEPPPQQPEVRLGAGFAESSLPIPRTSI